jgi:hypothetical protein
MAGKNKPPTLGDLVKEGKHTAADDGAALVKAPKAYVP